ncbi:MAG: thiamine-phosphate kinase, partial [Nitrospirae bacterium]
IGDDAAVVRLPAGHRLLLTTDLLAEGIHFDLTTATYEDLGYKAAVANLSDIAAMGGTPRHMLVAMALPADRTVSQIRRLYGGLMKACRQHGVALIGGDTSASRGGLFISVTLTGTAPPGQVLMRDGARVGDFIYVTGTLGDSLAGLNLLTAQRRKNPPRYERTLMNRHLRPTARIAAGQTLASRGLATAAIDLSDGLSGDLAHLCEQSAVGAEITATALPLSPACRAYAAAHRVDPTRLALAGGEDYELLFTVSPKNRATVDRLAHEAPYRITSIGIIRPKSFGLRLRDEEGSLKKLTISSYQHFQNPPTVRS